MTDAKTMKRNTKYQILDIKHVEFLFKLWICSGKEGIASCSKS